MKPVCIVQQVHHDTPDYFVDFLAEAGIPWQVYRMDLNDPLPDDITQFSGYCMLGGPMSVNDDEELPWLKREMAMVREAMAADIAVIGHCLGGQLMAKALGGSVSRVPKGEIGWSEIRMHDEADAHRWFGGDNPVRLFQWHNEGFSLPTDARLIAGSPHWSHQAFTIGDKHLGMQFHCEVKADKVAYWATEERSEIEVLKHLPSVDSADSILASLPVAIPESNRIARHIYSEWIKGLKR